MHCRDKAYGVTIEWRPTVHYLEKAYSVTIERKPTVSLWREGLQCYNRKKAYSVTIKRRPTVSLSREGYLKKSFGMDKSPTARNILKHMKTSQTTWNLVSQSKNWPPEVRSSHLWWPTHLQWGPQHIRKYGHTIRGSFINYIDRLAIIGQRVAYWNALGSAWR